jgi:hypothetical protein
MYINYVFDIKLPRYEAVHSPLFSVDDKNDEAIPPLPHVFKAECLIN